MIALQSCHAATKPRLPGHLMGLLVADNITVPACREPLRAADALRAGNLLLRAAIALAAVVDLHGLRYVEGDSRNNRANPLTATNLHYRLRAGDPAPIMLALRLS